MKRKRMPNRPKGQARKKSKWTKNKKPRTVERIVKKILNKNLETKMAVSTSSDGLEIWHNNFVTLDSQVLAMTQGVKDSNTLGGGNTVRIGDEIMLKGISMKLMLELNERYSDVTFRIMVIRSARGDVPTRATLYNGLSGNKMLDSINKERYTIVAQKFAKLTSRNTATIGGDLVPGIPLGTNTQTDAQTVLSRATRIIKIWIPGSKFGKGGKIIYEGESAAQKFYDYNVVCYAYSNISSSQDIYYVGRVNDYIKQIYFKDA